MTTRNILLIGATGNGKSTLANVLTDSEYFKEGSGLISTTKNIQSKVFEYEGENYKIIDTIGLNDTSLNNKEILELLGKACEELEGNKIFQILFVVKNKLTEQEIENYNLLREIVFGEDIGSFTTIIRTDFKDFTNEKECQKKITEIKQEDSKLSEVINNSNGIVFVNNPQVETEEYFSDEEDKKTIEKINLKRRNKSRQKVFEHLKKNCNNSYLPDLENLKKNISSYLTENEKLQKDLAEMSKNIEELKLSGEKEKLELADKLQKDFKKKEESFRRKSERDERWKKSLRGDIKELKRENSEQQAKIVELRQTADRYWRWYQQEKSNNSGGCQLL